MAGKHLQSTETKVRSVRSDQYIFSSSWQAWLKARNGSGNPWSINCLIPENVVSPWHKYPESFAVRCLPRP